MAAVPKIIQQIRAQDQGSWDTFMEDYSTRALEKALEWALHNDSNITVLIEDELRFRAEEGE